MTINPIGPASLNQNRSIEAEKSGHLARSTAWTATAAGPPAYADPESYRSRWKMWTPCGHHMSCRNNRSDGYHHPGTIHRLRRVRRDWCGREYFTGGTFAARNDAGHQLVADLHGFPGRVEFYIFSAWTISPEPQCPRTTDTDWKDRVYTVASVPQTPQPSTLMRSDHHRFQNRYPRIQILRFDE